MSWQDDQRKHLLFTWASQRDARGFEIDDATGARFHVPGKGWVWDLESQVYNVNVGHKHPHVQKRMAEQVETLPAAGPHAVLPIRAELARLLHLRTGFAKAFLTTGGSEAVENAVKIARLVTGRGKVITRRHSYHGATQSMIAISGDPRRAPFSPWLPEPIHVDDPYPPRPPTASAPSDWVESLQSVLEREDPTSVAAIVLEGLTGTNGVQIPPADFWPRVRELCDQHGIMLVDDEIFSGFGRTGKWFAREHWGVQPDMMVIGKGLTSGYAPLAGVMLSRSIADHFEDEKLWCGLTHYAHPVACAAAVGSIEVLEREGLVANAERVGGVLRQALDGLRRNARTLGHVQDVRGLGLMQVLELDRPVAELARALWDANVYVPFRENALIMCPPLCITADEIQQVARVVEQAVIEFVRG